MTQTPQQGGHAIPGEVGAVGRHDGSARSYDPLAGPGAGAPGQVVAWRPVAPPPPRMAPLPPAAEKSVGIAFLLTFLFGPLGMLYSTVTGALVLIAVTVVLAIVVGIVVGLISLATLGFGAVLVVLAPLAGAPIWIASIIWGCLAASRHNERVRAQLSGVGRAGY